MKRAKPKTSAEAVELMNQAIEDCDYKAAKYYHEQIKYLENFEETKAIAGHVANYLEKKDEISNQIYENIQRYSQDIERAKHYSIEFHKNEFIKLRDFHRNELEDLIEDWDQERSSVTYTVEEQYQQTLDTAKLVADTYNFDAAINLQKQAAKILKTGGRDDIKQFDRRMHHMAELMLKRQEEEITNLKTTRDIELQILNEMLKAAETQTLEDFFNANANEVSRIIEKFPKEISVPIALQMQITRAKPQPKSDAPVKKSTYKKFTKTMHNVNRIVNNPIDIADF
ncbi:hypothetical protein TVAG_340400 [Trichomonas vaginalis G3]|uniref:Uncharacterized protein n=1 Tax=Trichomonas vaginalis (strain ATCC PRA-98 / G3) TaxID=412133 RepID=A2EKF4_TRIV3|nr:hypothetical protein TVAGG3_0979800 [Trichomonas vaginalis G3]EAY06862.1 hypothetical protein TVAG_340400 [Trichomonas vaginalis G3]KAI5489198.1 hypothetical protein TVAGG3_0979800 [Trichomonas vaginalis G3]|eukprot:XP_001319085.1 hypothetical protein [Trichomonas vaginalis G3]